MFYNWRQVIYNINRSDQASIFTNSTVTDTEKRKVRKKEKSDALHKKGNQRADIKNRQTKKIQNFLLTDKSDL